MFCLLLVLFRIWLVLFYCINIICCKTIRYVVENILDTVFDKNTHSLPTCRIVFDVLPRMRIGIYKKILADSQREGYRVPSLAEKYTKKTKKAVLYKPFIIFAVKINVI